MTQSSSPEAAEAPQDGVKLFTLPFPNDQIIVVEDNAQFSRFLDTIEGFDLVGLDAEWKPSFGLKDNDLALIQVSTFLSLFFSYFRRKVSN